MSYLLVGLGGAIGAILRFATSQWFLRMGQTGFPAATLTVNVVGSLLIGLVIGYLSKTEVQWATSAKLLIATGFCGGFTTFSAFSLDVVQLFERGAFGAAALYIGLSVLLSIGAAFCGIAIMRGII